MARDLNNLVTRLTCLLKFDYNCFPRRVISDQHIFFLHSGGKQLATDFIIFRMRYSPIRVLEYQVAVIGRGTIVKYSGPEFFKASGRWLNHSSNSWRGSLSPPSVDHICCGEWRVGFRRPPCLVLVGFYLKLNHFTSIILLGKK